MDNGILIMYVYAIIDAAMMRSIDGKGNKPQMI